MPKTEADFPLKDAEWQELLKLAQYCQREADACYCAGAKVASCVMIAGGVEAMLLVVANLFCEDVKKLATRKGSKKLNDLLRWDLNQLLDVAKEARWLPDKLTISPRVDFRKDRVPVPIDFIREARNLVHPGRVVRERPERYVNEEELALLYGACHAAHSCIQDKVFSAFPKAKALFDLSNAQSPSHE